VKAVPWRSLYYQWSPDESTIRKNGMGKNVIFKDAKNRIKRGSMFAVEEKAISDAGARLSRPMPFSNAGAGLQPALYPFSSSL
jgi:hypothetical protein